jgi:hypothetical protein
MTIASYFFTFDLFLLTLHEKGGKKTKGVNETERGVSPEESLAHMFLFLEGLETESIITDSKGSR